MRLYGVHSVNVKGNGIPTMDTREKLRRRYVQATSEDCAGFCMKCGGGVPKIQHGHKGRCPHCSFSTLVLDREEERVIIEWKDRKYQTSYDGWTRRTVAGEERYTKRMDDGELVALDRLAAARHGLVESAPRKDEIPSVPMSGESGAKKSPPGGWYAALKPSPSALGTPGKAPRSLPRASEGGKQAPREARPKKPRLGASGLLSHGALGKAISAEARKLAQGPKAAPIAAAPRGDARRSQIVDPEQQPSGAEALRKKHVSKRRKS